MKKLIIALAAGIAMFAVDAAPGAGKPTARSASGAPRVQKAGSAKTSHGPAMKRGGVTGLHDRDRRLHRRAKMSRQDQVLLDKIEEANSIRDLRRYIRAAVSSREEDVRTAMVDALEMADEHSPADFVYFIADPSEDVAEAAFSAWSSALDDVKAHRRVRAIIEAGQILQGAAGGNWQGQPPPPSTVVQPVVVPAAQPVTVPAVPTVVY